VGLLGEDNAGKVERTFRRLKVQKTVHFSEFLVSSEQVRDEARKLVAKAKCPEDILDWELPFGFPAGHIYDAIQAKQKKAIADLGHGRFEGYVVEALRSLYAADVLLYSQNFKLIIVSHPTGWVCGGLLWRAAQLGIPVVVVNPGMVAGLTHISRVTTPMDIYNYENSPTRDELDELSPKKAEALRTIGEYYLERRFSKGTHNLPEIYAFHQRDTMIDREGIAASFGWDSSKPIVAVYCSCWFDFQHSVGMTQFRDYLEWTKATVNVAREVCDVNWLIKGHPADEWYKGDTVEAFFDSKIAPHVRLAPNDWNGLSVMRSVDGIVSIHGTVGIEGPALGTPVMVADRGWYHDLGFVKWTKNREEYLEALRHPWWREINMPTATSRAQIFAGMFYCAPDWQNRFMFEDEHRKYDLYHNLSDIIKNNPGAVSREVAEMRDWYVDGHKKYHIFKMLRASGYAFPEVPS